MLWRFTVTSPWIQWILPTYHAGRVEHTVHQQFWSAKPETWPPEWRSFSSFWQRSNWTWRFWTDEDEERLFAEELPEFEELYHWIPNCLDAKISQADLSAYGILYVHGGVYADMDTMPLLPLDLLIDAAVEAAQGRDLVLLPTISRPDEDLEIRGVGGIEDPFSLDTDLMVSTAPRHPFFLEALRSIRDYVVKHNQSVCGRDRRTPTYDLMFLTAWGRLSMLARSWQNGLNQTQLHFLESLFLREPVDATLAHLALHVLSHHSLEELQAREKRRSCRCQRNLVKFKFFFRQTISSWHRWRRALPLRSASYGNFI